MIISPVPSLMIVAGFAPTHESKVTVWSAVSTVNVCEFRFRPQSLSLGAVLPRFCGSQIVKSSVAVSFEST